MFLSASWFIFMWSLFKLLLLLLSFVLTTNAFACVKTITVSAASDWTPYSFRNETGGYSGMDIEIVNLVFSKLGFCTEFVAFPSSARSFVELQKGNVDVIFAASWTQDRQNMGSFSAPYRKEYLSSFSHTSNDIPFQFDAGKIVAVNRGSFFGQKFQQYSKSCNNCVVEVSQTKQRFQLLKSQRIDYAIEDLFSGLYFIQRSEFKPYIKLDNEAVHSNHVHFILNKHRFDEVLVKRVNSAIDDSDEQISQLIAKYRNKLSSQESRQIVE